MTIEENKDTLPNEVMEAIVLGVRMDHAYSKSIIRNVVTINHRKKNKDGAESAKLPDDTGNVVLVVKRRKTSNSDPTTSSLVIQVEEKQRKTLKRKENIDHSYQQKEPKKSKTIPATKKKNIVVKMVKGIKPPAKQDTVIKAGPRKRGRPKKESQPETKVDLKVATNTNNKRLAKSIAKKPTQVPKAKSVGRPKKTKRDLKSVPQKPKATASKAKNVRTYTNKGVPSGNILMANILQGGRRRTTGNNKK